MTYVVWIDCNWIRIQDDGKVDWIKFNKSYTFRNYLQGVPLKRGLAYFKWYLKCPCMDHCQIFYRWSWTHFEQLLLIQLVSRTPYSLGISAYLRPLWRFFSSILRISATVRILKYPSIIRIFFWMILLNILKGIILEEDKTNWTQVTGAKWHLVSQNRLQSGQFEIHQLQSLQIDESDAFVHAIWQCLASKFEKSMLQDYTWSHKQFVCAISRTFK